MSESENSICVNRYRVRRSSCRLSCASGVYVWIGMVCNARSQIVKVSSTSDHARNRNIITLHVVCFKCCVNSLQFNVYSKYFCWKRLV